MAQGKHGSVVTRSRMRDVSHLKPERFQDHMTLTEVVRDVKRDPSWIKKLEREGRIPKAQRFGKLRTRLWSPKQVEEIRQVIANSRPGRPRKDA